MNDNKHKDMASEPIAMTYGMSADLRNSRLLNEVQNLSRVTEKQEETLSSPPYYRSFQVNILL